MGKDYYNILGIDNSASQEDIRAAYLKLAKEWHPDLRKSAADKELATNKFQDIAEAFEILSHPTRKQVYDKGGEEALTAGGKRTVHGPIPSTGIPPNSANRLAAQFFGYGIQGLDPSTGSPLGGNNVPMAFNKPGFNLAGYSQGTTTVGPNGMQTTTYSRSSSAQNGIPSKPVSKRPVMLPCECTLEELFTGCEKDVEWNAYENGKSVTKVFTVDVQPGWMIGQKVHVDDDYDEVTIFITETKHAMFRRGGREGDKSTKDDLHYECTINLHQAVCCGEIIIPTIVKTKNIKLKFSGSVSHGQVYEIADHGMPINGTDKRGKLIVTFNIRMPCALTDDQRSRISAILNE